jgi:hypothetical protein
MYVFAKRHHYPFVVLVGFYSNSYPVHRQTLCRQKNFGLRSPPVLSILTRLTALGPQF